jgi:nucleoside-diphosphate-sugar epimerase
MTRALPVHPALTGVGAQRLAKSDLRIAVVGAGGWLGLATLELLYEALGERFLERVECFGATDRILSLRGGRRARQRPLDALAALASSPTLVLHLAFLTQEKAKAMTAHDYVAANGAISAAVHAALDPIGAVGVFVASSGAVYLADQADAEASKRLYGRVKLADEALFGRWAEDHARRAVIARIFNLSGPYINKQSSYALACFIADALANRPIEIRAASPVQRSFIAISELMSVVFGALTDGERGTILFDAAGDRVYEMAEIAEAVGRRLGAALGVRRPPMTDGPADRYVGDGAVYRSLRARFGVVPVEFETQVDETAGFMAQVAPVSPRFGG